MLDVPTLTWDAQAVPDALHLLAREAALPARRPDDVRPRVAHEDAGRWVEACARWQGNDAVRVDATCRDLAWIVSHVSSLLMQVPSQAEPRFIAICRAGRRYCRVAAPDSTIREVRTRDLIEALRPALGEATAQSCERLLEDAGIESKRRERVRSALAAERLADVRVTNCWTLRFAPGADFVGQLRRAGVARRLGGLTIVYVLHYGLWLASWWVIGRMALSGRADGAWIVAWVLLLLCTVPLRAFLTSTQGLVAVTAGGVLKQRLLAGALRIDPEETRHQGAGQWLGRVLESEAVESLSIGGGLLAFLALLELAMSTAVIAAGPRGGWQVTLLVLWTGLVTGLAWRYYRQRRAWTAARVDLTNDVVERMLGHRTRISQESPERWHSDEDDAVDRCLRVARPMDATEGVLRAVGPRGWLLVAIGGLVPAFVAGSGPESLALGVGGVLLAQQAFRKLATGLSTLAGAAVAWRAVEPLFHAASRPDRAPAPYLAVMGSATSGNRPVLDARNVAYRYPGRSNTRDAVADCSFTLRSGECARLEGPSGGGKSTLAMLLAGLRQPTSGSLSVMGIDRSALGSEGWRNRVALAPQFHDNHVLTGSLAFNLLMGRRWPPTRDDLKEAEAICRELGLGDLLAKLPAGLMQVVGETGWQLSHGERSRVYVARALLQRAPLVIVDESLAALDPENLSHAVECVRRRAQTVLLIAHP